MYAQTSGLGFSGCRWLSESVPETALPTPKHLPSSRGVVLLAPPIIVFPAPAIPPAGAGIRRICELRSWHRTPPGASKSRAGERDPRSARSARGGDRARALPAPASTAAAPGARRRPRPTALLLRVRVRVRARGVWREGERVRILLLLVRLTLLLLMLR